MYFTIINCELVRNAISLANTGKICSQETRNTISLANTGKIRSQETRNNISLANTGKIRSQEHRNAISLANLLPDTFDKHILELRAYKEEHGDCNVQKSHNKQLYTWVQNSRSIRKSDNQQTRHTKDRIRKLDDVGFIWDQHEARLERIFSAEFAELKAYKEDHGNCEVSKKINISLYGWMMVIRRAHQRKCQGLPTSKTLLDEWVQRLNELGFVWSKPSAY